VLLPLNPAKGRGEKESFEREGGGLPSAAIVLLPYLTPNATGHGGKKKKGKKEGRTREKGAAAAVLIPNHQEKKRGVGQYREERKGRKGDLLLRQYLSASCRARLFRRKRREREGGKLRGKKEGGRNSLSLISLLPGSVKKKESLLEKKTSIAGQLSRLTSRMHTEHLSEERRKRGKRGGEAF